MRPFSCRNYIKPILIFFAFMVSMLPFKSISNDLTIHEWLDIFVESCVGSGSKFVANGSVDAGIGLALRKFTVGGELAGEVLVKKQEYRLLSEGISNAMTDISADQADKVRACLAPVRRNIIIIMSRDMGLDEQNMSANSFSYSLPHILSPYEEKIMEVMAKTRGLKGGTGELIEQSVLLKYSEMSDIRFRSTLRMLEEKNLIWPMLFPDESKGLNLIPVVSLEPNGEEYVLEMEYAH